MDNSRRIYITLFFFKKKKEREEHFMSADVYYTFDHMSSIHSFRKSSSRSAFYLSIKRRYNYSEPHL